MDDDNDGAEFVAVINEVRSFIAAGEKGEDGNIKFTIPTELVMRANRIFTIMREAAEQRPECPQAAMDFLETFEELFRDAAISRAGYEKN